MSISLSEKETRWLQQHYNYLVNYASDNINDPIDPATYVDSGGDNLLHIAAFRGDTEAVGMLLRAGVDPNLPGEMGYTALHYSHKGKYQEVSALLIEFGARSDIRNKFGKLAGEP